MSTSLASLAVKLRVATDLANQPNLPAALAAIAPRFLAAAAAYAASEVAVRKAVEQWAKEAPEAAAAIAELEPIYDSSRRVVLSYLPGLIDDGPASSHTTPEATLDAAAGLIDLLTDHAADPWAPGLSAELETALGKASKEFDEKKRAGEVERTARTERAVAADRAWQEFREFRQMIRAAYGATSRQFQSLRDHRSGTSEEKPTAGG